MEIKDQKKYDFFTSQIQYHNEKIIDSFNLFLKFAILLAGAIGWLLIQSKESTLDVEGLARVFIILRVAFLLVGIAAEFLILTNLRAKWGYRRAEIDLIGGTAYPAFPGSCLSEIIMTIFIFVTCLLFWLVNLL